MLLLAGGARDVVVCWEDGLLVIQGAAWVLHPPVAVRAVDHQDDDHDDEKGYADGDAGGDHC